MLEHTYHLFHLLFKKSGKHETVATIQIPYYDWIPPDFKVILFRFGPTPKVKSIRRSACPNPRVKHSHLARCSTNTTNTIPAQGSAHSPIRRHAVRLLNLQIDVEFATTSSRKTNDWIEPEWRPIHPLTMNNISSSKSIHELIDQLLEKRLHHCDTPSQIPWCCSLMVEIWNC